MLKKIFLILLFLCIQGCGQNQHGSENEILGMAINSLAKRVDQLQLNIIEENSKNLTTAVFTPADKDYQVIHTPNGMFYVALKNLEKYADGYKAIFAIGNPTYAIFANPKVNIKWGRSLKNCKSLQEEEDIENNFKKTSIDIQKQLLPGTWNTVVCVLSPATEEETGTIEISMESTEVVLSTDYRLNS